MATFPLLLVCVNFSQWTDVTTHILFGRRQMSTPWNGCLVPRATSGFLAWLCSCLCLWLYNAPWRHFMISLRQSWHEYLVSLATIFPLILIHLLSNIQYLGNCSPPHFQSQNRWQDFCWIVSHFPWCLNLLFSNALTTASNCRVSPFFGASRLKTMS